MRISLLAAINIETIIQIGVFLFIIISTLASQLVSKNHPRKPGQPPKPRPPRPRPRPARPGGRPGETLADHAPPAPQPRPWGALVDEALRGDPVQKAPVLAEPVRAEVVPVEPIVVRESVAEHVQRHIESGSIESARLHSTLERADERMTSHLHEAFDHRLGRLERKTRGLVGTTVAATRTSQPKPAPAEPSQDIAQRIAQMMQTPADFSAAIVLNEILKRPDDRWIE